MRWRQALGIALFLTGLLLILAAAVSATFAFYIAIFVEDTNPEGAFGIGLLILLVVGGIGYGLLILSEGL